MDYLPPAEMVEALVEAGAKKARLPVRDLLVRGALSGGILGIATTLAVTATAQTGMGIVGALIFPVGFVMIVLLQLELVTGSFAVLPMAVLEHRASMGGMLRNFGWGFIGNLIGALIYAALFAATLTTCFSAPPTGIADKIVALTEAKTLAYASHGAAGMLTAFIKAALCNWMVCLGVVMATLSRSTVSKVLAAWLPITIFFGLGFEHAVVNMFLIPCGMLLGAKTSVADWWLWNQIPVTLGNLCGGFLFTGLALYVTYAARGREAANDSKVTGAAPLAPISAG
jgi:formate/nitrite transporter